MGCGVYWQQIRELERALGTMERFGILETDPAYQALYGKRGALLAEVGKKFPRTTIPIAKVSVWQRMKRLFLGWISGSPIYTIDELKDATIKLWHDVESGWMSEARIRPSALPIYHSVSDEVAMAILKDELTPEMMAELLTPDEYLGE